MRRRLIQAALLALVIYGGVRAWDAYVQPPEDAFRTLVDAPLRELFGPGVTYKQPFEFDIGRGVDIEDLVVPSTGGLEESDGAGGMRPLAGFSARRVHIEHDPLALAAGRYRPLHIEIEGVRALTHETPSGIAADFPLEISSGRKTEGNVPHVHIADATLLYRAMPGSERLNAGTVVELHVRDLTLEPRADGTLQLDGKLATRGLGQDDTLITVRGDIAADGRTYGIEVRWDPVELTQSLLDSLAPDVAAPLRDSGIRTGTLVLRLRPLDGEEGGAIDPQVEWNSEMEMRVPDLPGLEAIDASTREQLDKLFGNAAVHVELGGGRVSIKTLVTEMGTGRVQATGWIVQETGEFTIDFDIRDLELDDPAVRGALGEDGAGLYDEFDPQGGLIDAIGRVTRGADGVVSWSVDVILEDADLAYVGDVGPDGVRVGFPYRVQDASGRLRIDAKGVTFDEIIGFNRGAEIRILGGREKGWQGGPTGLIRFTDQGTSLNLTIVATNMPVDDELITAIRGSDFADMLEEYEIQGVIDRAEIDLTKDPAIERKSVAELRLTLGGEQFRYVPFPLPLEDVSGQLTMQRPVLADGRTRGRVYAFDITGWAEGAAVRASAKIPEHEKRGRLRVASDGLPLAGAVTEAVLASPKTADGLADVWRWLGPRGRANVHVDLPLSEDPGPLKLDAELRGASLRLGAESEAPLEIEKLTGKLSVVGKDVALEQLRGVVGGARVDIAGRLEGGVAGAWDLAADIAALRLSPSLLRSFRQLAPGGTLLPGGMEFESGSRMALALQLRKEPGAEATPSVAFTASQLDTAVRLPDGTTLGLSGEALAVDRGVVTARNLRAQAEGLTAEVRTLRVAPTEDDALTGQFRVAFDDFTITEGVYDLIPGAAADLLRRWTDNRTLRSRAFTIDVPRGGPVRLQGDLALIPPDEGPIGGGARGRFEVDPLIIRSRGDDGVAIEGIARLTGFSIDVGIELENLSGPIEVEYLALGGTPEGRGRIAGVSGRIADLSVVGLSAPVDWTAGILRIPAISGHIVGGELVGDLVMHTQEPMSYEGSATVRGFSVAQLRDDLAPTGAAYEGVGTAKVTFQNRGGSARDLTGAGVVSIRAGRLGDLPFITNIFTLTDELVGVEDRPQFERADVVFTLEKQVFTFRRFDLAGTLLDMPGTGTLDLTGVVDLRFTPDFVKGLILPGVMQLPGIGTILRGLLREEFVYAVRVHGDLDSAEPEIVFLPLLGYDRGDDFPGAGARDLPPRRLPGWFR